MDFYISQKAWKRVLDYAQASYDKFQAEVGGFLIATKDKDNDIILSHPEILEQTVTSGTTEMDKAAIADYYVKSAMKHGNDVRFVWWHSHANMGAFWSGTDTSTMEDYSSGDWSAFLVVNIRGEYKFRICVWNPIEAHEDTELKVIDGKMRSVPKTIVKQVEELCSKPAVVKRATYTGVAKGRQTSLTMADYIDDYQNGSYGYGYMKPGSSFGYKQGFTGTSLYDSTLTFLDELCALYTDGEFNFKEWLKEVKNWNKILKRKKATFTITEVTENDLHLKCGFYTGTSPADFIDYEVSNG